jgi:DNA-binding response OmpR family regulator
MERVSGNLAPAESRETALQDGLIELGNIVLQTESFRVYLEGRALELTYKEFELLRLFGEQPGRVLAYDLLTRELWGLSGHQAMRRLNVLVHRLRSKLESAAPYAIETVRGRGYGLLKPLEA